MVNALEFTIFETIIKSTFSLKEFVLTYHWFFVFIHVNVTFMCVILFESHLLKFSDLDFFLDNVNKLYSLNLYRYKLNRIIYSIFLPLTFIVIIMSFFQMFNSIKFLKRFG